jgi:hypothetical protein
MDYRDFIIRELENLNKDAKILNEQADVLQYKTWRLQATFAKLEPDKEKDKKIEEKTSNAA